MASSFSLLFVRLADHGEVCVQRDQARGRRARQEPGRRQPCTQYVSQVEGSTVHNM